MSVRRSLNTDGFTPLHGVPSCSSSQAFSLTQAAPHLQLSIHSMALDSGSDTARPESNSTPRDTHGDSPEQPAQSDDPGPADSDGDSEVYEIEAILDAKRGATGSVSSCCHLLTKKTRLTLFILRPESVTLSSGKGTQTKRTVGLMKEMLGEWHFCSYCFFASQFSLQRCEGTHSRVLVTPWEKER